jgi:hypothetical protein
MGGLIMFKKYFKEDEEISYLERLMNKKSNLILNLNTYEGNLKKNKISEVAYLELEIIKQVKKKLEIKDKSKKSLVYNSLISAINILIDYFPRRAYKIALKGLNDGFFEENIRIKFLNLINQISRENEDIFSENNFQMFNYILKKHVEESIKIKKQNLNKYELFIFDKLDYQEILITNLDLHPRKIHLYPFYSPEIDDYLKNLLRMNILKQDGNYLYPNIYYRISVNQSHLFERKIDSDLIKKIDQLIYEFSNFTTRDIELWEKDLKFLEYFETEDIF